MRTKKLLAGALVCLLGLSAVTACGEKEEPSTPAPTQQTADKLIKRVTIDSSVYMQATHDFALPTSVLDGSIEYPVTWVSDNSTNAKIAVEQKEDKDGNAYSETVVKIVRPAYDKDATELGVPYTLTASIKTGEFTQSKEFKGYVMMLENLLKVNDVKAIYTDFASETHDSNRPYVVDAYVAQQVKDGFFLRSSDSDEAIYFYGRDTLGDNGLEVGDKINVQGKVSRYNGGLQFSYKDAIVKPVKKAEPKQVGMKAVDMDLATLAGTTTEEGIAALAYKKLTLTGKVKVVQAKYTDYYLETAEDSWKVKFDYGASVKDVYKQLESKAGQEITCEVIYHGGYNKKTQHTVDIIAIK